MRRLLAISAIFALYSIAGQGKVVAFKYAPEVEKSTLFTVTANGKSQTVLSTQEPDVCIFDCDSPVTVTVKWSKPASRVDVRPLSLDFSHKFENGVLTLKMKPKDRVVVEFDGDSHKPLFIFANAIDREKPSPRDAGVHYYKAGRVYDAGEISLKTGETLYLEGGAVLRGNVNADGADNISLLGSGIIDARDNGSRAVSITKSRDIAIKGITVFNRKEWCTYIAGCDNIRVENYKVVAEYNDKHVRGLENDALDFVSSRNATVAHCFSYCHDDAYCIKTAIYGITGKASHISFEDCIAWNVRGGNSFEIGYAINEDIEDISYRNMYSIHMRENERCTRSADISIHCAGKGVVRNVSYENIFLEETDNYTIHFDIFNNGNCESFYGYRYTPGGIENVSLKNIYTLYEQPKGSVIRGYDADHPIRNVTIENMVVNGKKVTDMQAGSFNIINSDVKFKAWEKE